MKLYFQYTNDKLPPMYTAKLTLNLNVFLHISAHDPCPCEIGGHVEHCTPSFYGGHGCTCKSVLVWLWLGHGATSFARVPRVHDAIPLPSQRTVTHAKHGFINAVRK